MKHFSILILLIILGSCRTKYIEKVETKLDSIIVDRVLTITPASLNEIILEDICDSLGVLKPISYVSSSNKTKTSVKSYQNTLKIEIDIDSIKEEAISTFQKTLIDKEHKEVKPVRFIPKWAWYSLLVNSILLAWIFRKPLIRLIKPI